ncbi:MAG TPA: lysophospholipid acyltransferase family protein [Galbitalea sp.]|jgi:1-acyl-sn-glycerol-3-phosphate acyltransferase|nr:lysophospholipid acyltransferase family protein [Galbitalea sp.]
MLYRLAMFVCHSLGRFFRVRRTGFGEANIPADGGAVLAVTHFGYLEFALVAWSIWRADRRRVLFLATAGAFRNPIVGGILRRLGQIPVDHRAGAAAYSAAVDALRSGSLVGVFPEAGVDASFTVRALKTGAVRLAAEADVPLIPVAIWGGQRLLTREHKVRFRERFNIPVSIAFGPPLSLVGERHAVSAKLRAELQQLVASLQKDYPDDGAGQWWQPRALGGTAPTPEEAAELDAAVVARREAKRAAKRGKSGREDGA